MSRKGRGERRVRKSKRGEYERGRMESAYLSELSHDLKYS